MAIPASKLANFGIFGHSACPKTQNFMPVISPAEGGRVGFSPYVII
jgi:hypothetical protein